MTQKYLLKDVTTYLDKWIITPSVACDHYRYLLVEYITYVEKNQDSFKVPNRIMFNYIIISGIETISHIFKMVMIHTNNIDATLYHAQTGILLYIEFIIQITQNTSVFLKLSIRDAIIYVYKKTIFNLKEKMTDTHSNIDIDSITDSIHNYQYEISKYICNNVHNQLTGANVSSLHDILNESR
jgi:hypothetical protein